MLMNPIQFQPGLTMPDFLKQFGTEVQCEAELEQARWPQGFVCPCCAHTGHSVFKAGSHKTFQCQACRHQTSLIAGTVFQSTRLPLTVWFLAIYLISQAKTGLSSLALKRHLGVSYPTARLIQRKLKDAMPERETTLSSWPPLLPGLAQTPDSGQVKHLDDQESKER
jgi:transposase-like protein